MEHTGIQLGVFPLRLLWVISCTNTSLSLMFPAQLENFCPEPWCSTSTPHHCDHPGTLSWIYPSARGEREGERERRREVFAGGGETFLQGQQIRPRTSTPLGSIPKQNKISLIFQQAGGEASLPTFPEAGAGQPHSPFPQVPREKDLG